MNEWYQSKLETKKQKFNEMWKISEQINSKPTKHESTLEKKYIIENGTMSNECDCDERINHKKKEEKPQNNQRYNEASVVICAKSF